MRTSADSFRASALHRRQPFQKQNGGLMSIVTELNRVFSCATTPAAERIRSSGHFEIDDIPLLHESFVKYNFAPGTSWDDLRGTFLTLPSWYHHGLDPMSDAYAAQQRRLWCAVAGVDRDYNAEIDEENTESHTDPVRFPSYFIRRDPGVVVEAAHHTLAMGVMLMNSNLKPGQWALEYGAGFGLTALHLARIGVNVDTVDISPKFCRHVQDQADFYGVPLRPHQGQFGWNPRGDEKYDFIWFYECFHHCLEFRQVVHQLKRHLAPNGKLILAGEPILRREAPVVPYPWGLRVESDVVAIVREKHWFELGFSEDFLVTLFTRAGFAAERVECAGAPYGEGYAFMHRGDRIQMASHWMPLHEDATWFEREPNGRWSRGDSWLTVDETETYSLLEIDMSNCHAREQQLDIAYGAVRLQVQFAAGERRSVRLNCEAKAPKLNFWCETFRPPAESGDPRSLGVLLHEVRYL